MCVCVCFTDVLTRLGWMTLFPSRDLDLSSCPCFHALPCSCCNWRTQCRTATGARCPALPSAALCPALLRPLPLAHRNTHGALTLSPAVLCVTTSCHTCVRLPAGLCTSGRQWRDTCGPCPPTSVGAPSLWQVGGLCPLLPVDWPGMADWCACSSRVYNACNGLPGSGVSQHPPLLPTAPPPHSRHLRALLSCIGRRQPARGWAGGAAPRTARAAREEAAAAAAAAWGRHTGHGGAAGRRGRRCAGCLGGAGMEWGGGPLLVLLCCHFKAGPATLRYM